MVEQLWYTWSPVGIPKIQGFQVRAASSGLANLQSPLFKEMDPQLRYYLPTGTDLYEVTPATAPTTLSFIRTSEGCILVHKVYIGKDAGGRPGNYFCHVLANLPRNFMASDAINLWKSPFWSKSDASLPEASLTLPSINDFALYKEKGSLDYADLQEVQDFLPFVIEAYLLLKFDQRLYIYAPDGIVATLIWGLAHCITQAMQPGLTFSTYEQNVDKENVDKANIRVVGSCRAPSSSDDQGAYASTSRQQDLPESCYSGGRGYAINCYTGKRSQLPGRGLEAVYAQFVTKRLVDVNLQATLANKLEKLKDIEDKGSFLAFFKLRNLDDELFVSLLRQYGHSTELSRQEITALLNDYEQAVILLEERGIQDAVIKLVSEDEAWWNEHGVPAFENLANPRNAAFGKSAIQALHALAMRTISGICKSAFNQDWMVFGRLIQLLIKITPVETSPGVWIHLQLELTSPSFSDPSYHPGNVFPWEWHLWLLSAWQIVANGISDESIRPWLEINWEELEDLLKNISLLKWHVMAIKTLMEYSLPIPAHIAFLVSNYFEPFQATLELLMQNPVQQPLAISFFQQMVQCGCQKKLDLLLLLLNYDIEEPRNFELMLRSANLTIPERNLVFENKTWQLLCNVANSPSVQVMAGFYLENLSLEKLDGSGRQVLQLLHRARQHFPPRLERVSVYLENWMLVSEGFPPKRSVSPPLKVEEKHLIAMRDAIIALQLGIPQYRDRLFWVIINTELTHEQLDLVVKSFASVFTRNHSRKEFLSELGSFIGSRYKSNESNPHLWQTLLPYIMLALAYAHELQGASKDKFVDKVLRSGILQHNDKETFENIHRQSAHWPVEIRSEWNRYAGWLRPTSFSEKVQAVGRGVVGIILPKPSQQPQRHRNGEEQIGILPAIDQRKPAGGTSGGLRSSSADSSPDSPTHHTAMPAQRNVTYPGQGYYAQQNQPGNSQEWLEKVRQVKSAYYSIKIARLRRQFNSGHSGTNNAQILQEKDRLEAYLNLEKLKQHQEIQRELEEDNGLQERLAHVSDSKRREDELKRQLDLILSEIKSATYREQLKWIPRDEIEKILRIYITRELYFS